MCKLIYAATFIACEFFIFSTQALYTMPGEAVKQFINEECCSVEVYCNSLFPMEQLPVTEIKKSTMMSEEDIGLIALVTMAEAEGECEEGKRLVIDTILNRIDSEYFPDHVWDVIYQPKQFSSMWNGRVDCCVIQDDICRLVREELETRMNYEVIFFTAGAYGKYGEPMFQIGNHYFSSYE